MEECLNLLLQKSAAMTRGKHEEWVVEWCEGEGHPRSRNGEAQSVG